MRGEGNMRREGERGGFFFEKRQQFRFFFVLFIVMSDDLFFSFFPLLSGRKQAWLWIVLHISCYSIPTLL
jgi:hypothetical protein